MTVLSRLRPMSGRSSRTKIQYVFHNNRAAQTFGNDGRRLQHHLHVRHGLKRLSCWAGAGRVRGRAMRGSNRRHLEQERQAQGLRRASCGSVLLQSGWVQGPTVRHDRSGRETLPKDQAGCPTDRRSDRSCAPRSQLTPLAGRRFRRRTSSPTLNTLSIVVSIDKTLVAKSGQVRGRLGVHQQTVRKAKMKNDTLDCHSRSSASARSPPVRGGRGCSRRRQQQQRRRERTPARTRIRGTNPDTRHR